MISSESQICGKLMLAGEYSVLRGGRALASTVSSALSAEVRLSESADRFEIHSELWSEPKKLVLGNADENQDPLVDCVRDFADALKIRCGGTIRVRSQLDIKHGLGSSSAMRLAVADAMLRASNQSEQDSWQIPELAYLSQLKRQGQASGYDIATQWLGGSVLFRRQMGQPWPGTVQRIPGFSDTLNRWVHPLVGGEGAPTQVQLQSTSKWLDKNARWNQVLEASELLIDEILKLNSETKELPASLISCVKAHRQIFEGSPNFPHRFFAELSRLSHFDQTWTAKPTGAGGEDAILVFASNEQMEFVELAARELGWHRMSSFFNEPKMHPSGGQTL